MLAGLAVFPLVFANGLDPASGPGLVFVSLPLAFTGMALGRWAALALGKVERFANATAFDLIDEATSNLLLPIGGLTLALFTGWVLRRGWVAESLGLRDLERAVLRVALRYVAPTAILAAAVGSCV